MTSRPKGSRFISRGTDYLGDLASKLRDLVGYTTLAHELIQNADDSSGAREISFDFLQEGLVVDNDGVFASCGNIEADECPWKGDESIGRMCDFHRFRRVASGDKRNESDTTGAFGIGFISVYQITDQPELISAGQHWIIHDISIEAERIEICAGCPKCQSAKLPGTRFFLTWAEDPTSTLRKALSAGVVTAENRRRLQEDLEVNLIPALLFLRNIGAVSIKKDGVTTRKLTKKENDEKLVIADGKKRQEWVLLEGDFSQDAISLRQKHAGRIEEKRKDALTLAISNERLNSGLLYAYLPTQHTTGLQFHINADFYPSSDRKRVILEQDYQSEWNRAAISASAEILARQLDELPLKLGHQRLWEVISSCELVSRNEPTGPFSVFWQSVRPELAQHDLIFTTKHLWASAGECLLLGTPREEAGALPILEKLGLNVVHEDLRPHFNILTSKEVGVGLVDIHHITTRLLELGLSRRVERSELPPFLKSRSAFDTLLTELSLLLGRRRDAETQKRMQAELASCAIAIGIDGALWQCSEIFRADPATVDLFKAIDNTLPFIANTAQERIALLSPEFDVEQAIKRLAQLAESELARASDEKRFTPDQLIGWFEDRREPILTSPSLKKQLVQLPIFPTADALLPLTKLALPGDFDDPLGLANIINVERLGGRREFLRNLGAEKLTFQTYVQIHVPLAFSHDSLSADKKHQLVELVSTRLGEIRDSNSIGRTLSSLELVECEDGEYRLAAEAYIRNQEIVSVLGETPHFAAISGRHKDAVREFYHWLGVATEPRTSDISSRVKELVAIAPTAKSRQTIQSIVHYCGRRFHQAPDSFDIPSELQRIAWLPARGISNRWCKPDEVFATFQSYLFESQAKFLDLAPRIQQESVAFLEEIGVSTSPTVLQVVKHLLHCASTNTSVNKDVYRVLNDGAEDKSILLLKNSPCLMLPDSTFVRPDQVFWGTHPFGTFRHVLGEELRKYGALFIRLNVRESPDHSDALAVIKEISERYGATNSSLDDGAHSALLASWQMLDRALESEEVVSTDLSVLQDLKVIPNQDRVLNPSVWMFFDDRAGLAAKFDGFLKNNAITKPVGAWRAMAAAGVRALSTAIEVQILECVDPLPDDKVLDRLRSRSEQLSRVLEVQIGPEIASTAKTVLQEIRCESVTDLKIRYLLQIFNREKQSQPEDVQAHYSRDQMALYFLRREGIIPWSSIARELAIAVFPEGEPGHLALGFSVVLAADSDEALKATLDELGFASVESTSPGPMDAVPPTIGELGVDNPPPHVGPINIEEDGREGTDEGTDGDASPISAGDAVNAILGEGIPPPLPPPPELVEPPPPPGNGTGAGTRGTRGPSKSRKQSKRITYVTHNGSQEPGKPDEEVSDKRSAIEEAGIARVVEAERHEGRSPSIMPPLHPGYDIESKDPDGSIARYIEVKASSGVWGDRGVEVHRKQFEVARTKGEKYWLYVVEKADTDDYHIYAIQNPEDKVDDFIFDYGWREVAEEEVKGDAIGED